MSEQRRGISSEDGEKWSDDEPIVWPVAEDASVERIVIGSLEEKAAVPLDETFVAGLAGAGKGALKTLSKAYPNLKCLHLWGVTGVKEIVGLPSDLQELDVRNCPDFRKLSEWPKTLKVLVLNGSSGVKALPEVPPANVNKIEELELEECRDVSEKWIHNAMRESGELRLLKLSGCSGLTSVKRWPPKLQDARFNGCAQLKELPHRWGSKLRRVELSGTAVSESIPEIGGHLDYLDFSLTRGLKSIKLEEELEEDGGRFPRTLKLFGSGVTVPPAALHGVNKDVNVSEMTAGYFEDVKKAGSSEVCRCKVLFLGNGTAGKTCLSLALEGDPDPVACSKREGSTQGIRYRRLVEDEISVGKAYRDGVKIDLWDFGGQEIYHNTHRLFAGTGSVFVVLWDPEIDRKSEILYSNGYKDRPKPLRYWLDLIQEASPFARVAIVRSKSNSFGKACDEDLLIETLKSYKFSATGRFAIDSNTAGPDAENSLKSVGSLKKWIRKQSGEVIASEGDKVPTFWALGEELVSAWLEESGTMEASSNTRAVASIETFVEALGDFAESNLPERAEEDRQFQKLAKALVEDSNFLSLPGGEKTELTSRIKRMLHYLTNSGAIYWGEQLFDGNIIIDQAWALRGVYAVMDHLEGREVFKRLTASRGRFTIEQIDEWGWKPQGYTYSTKDRRLLIRFMESCGICFRLFDSERSYWEEELYVSIAHLWADSDLPAEERPTEQFETNARLDQEWDDGWTENKYFNAGHWSRILRDLSNHFGKLALYAKDSFFAKTAEGVAILIECSFEVGRETNGKYRLKVSGTQSDEVRSTVLNMLESRMPDRDTGVMMSRDDNFLTILKCPKKIRLFVSYARNDEDSIFPEDGSKASLDREEPVIYIVEQLKKHLGSRIKVLYDKERLGQGDSVVEFMKQAADSDGKLPEQERVHVLMISSKKYWNSQYCLYEACVYSDQFGTSSYDEMRRRATLVTLEDELSEKNQAAYKEKWSNFDTDKCSSGLLSPSMDGETLKTDVLSFLNKKKPELVSSAAEGRMAWKPEKKMDIVKRIIERLGASTDWKDSRYGKPTK